jgi:hypothetical protein
MNERGFLVVDDLYALSEKAVINKILTCEDKYLRDSFKKFQEATEAFDSDIPVEGKYCISLQGKRRYVIPLTINGNSIDRIYNISEKAKKDIDEYLAFSTAKYAYFDFEFKLN